MAQHGYLREYDEEIGGENREPSFMFGKGAPDEHYLNLRRKHAEALDRDYAEYMAEREQQFHRAFDAWRQQRRANQQPLQAGMTQTGTPTDQLGTLELTTEGQSGAEGGSDPMAAATLGTTSSGRR